MKTSSCYGPTPGPGRAGGHMGKGALCQVLGERLMPTRTRRGPHLRGLGLGGLGLGVGVGGEEHGGTLLLALNSEADCDRNLAWNESLKEAAVWPTRQASPSTPQPPCPLFLLPSTAGQHLTLKPRRRGHLPALLSLSPQKPRSWQWLSPGCQC